MSPPSLELAPPVCWLMASLNSRVASAYLCTPGCGDQSMVAVHNRHSGRVAARAGHDRKWWPACTHHAWRTYSPFSRKRLPATKSRLLSSASLCSSFALCNHAREVSSQQTPLNISGAGALKSSQCAMAQTSLILAFSGSLYCSQLALPLRAFAELLPSSLATRSSSSMPSFRPVRYCSLSLAAEARSQGGTRSEQ